MWVSIILLAVLYATGMLATARWWFNVIRPYTEPLSCKTKTISHHRHNRECYRRPGWQVDFNGEAASWALLLGLFWPIPVTCIATRRMFVLSIKLTPEEKAAKKAREKAEMAAKTAAIEEELET